MSKLFVFLVLCIASASCVELENLCSTDHFDYDGVLVNAFYKSPMNVTFPGLSHYLINNSVACDRSEFVNKTNFLEVLKIKHNFNRKFAEIYTNDLNGATAEELLDKKLSLSKYWSPLYHMTKVEPMSTCVQTFERIIYSAYNVLSNLDWVANYNSYPIHDDAGSKPSNFEATKILEKLFEELNAADGQTFAFKGKTVSKVYFYLELVLRGDFKFLTDGPVQPETESMFTYVQYLPFNSRQHTDEGCVSVKDLPRFYKNKGKK